MLSSVSLLAPPQPTNTNPTEPLRTLACVELNWSSRNTKIPSRQMNRLLFYVLAELKSHRKRWGYTRAQHRAGNLTFMHRLRRLEFCTGTTSARYCCGVPSTVVSRQPPPSFDANCEGQGSRFARTHAATHVRAYRYEPWLMAEAKRTPDRLYIPRDLGGGFPPPLWKQISNAHCEMRPKG